MSETEQQRQGNTGNTIGVPIIDPTANVIALNDAGHKRQDDLREMHNRYLEAKIEGLKERVMRVEQVSALRSSHAEAIGIIHQAHDREIHKMEQEKLAAFRSSDEAARLTEANRGLAAIEVLARTTQSTADNLRSALEATTATRDQRIAALEKSSYEGAGKGTGVKNLSGMIVAGVGLLVTLFMAALTVGGVIVAIAYAIKP